MIALLVTLAALALAGASMFGAAIRTLSNAWLQPVINPQFARTDSYKLAPGTYVAGLLLGNTNFGATATNDVQTITVSGTPTGGSFKLVWVIDTSYVTADIAYNATAAAVQTILEALFGVGNVTVSGSGFPGNTAVITFVGKAAAKRIPLATLYANALTGGTNSTAAVAHTTTGKAAGGEWVAYDENGSDEGQEVARAILKFPVLVDAWGVHKFGGTSNPSKALSAPAYYQGYFRTADLTGLDAAAVTDLGAIVRGNLASASNTGTILRVG